MNMHQEISRHVDNMIWEEDLPTKARLVPLRKVDELKPSEEDEEAYYDFRSWYMGQDMAPLWGIKRVLQPKEIRLWREYKEELPWWLFEAVDLF